MNIWINGWKDEWMNGWMDGWNKWEMEEWMSEKKSNISNLVSCPND